MTRIGFVGVGYWGPNILRNFGAMTKDVEVRAICDIDRKKLARFRDAFPRARLTADFDDVVRDREVDAVILALPARFHYRFAGKALESGKDVFVEKPLAMNSRECEDLITIAKNKKRIIFVGHTFIYNPAVSRIKEYIDKGRIGDIYYMYSQRLNLGKVREDVDVMWNLAPHDISVITYLLNNEPHAVSARGFYHLRKKIADVVFMTLEFANGISAHIHVSWLDPNKVRQFTIVGSKKMIVYDDVEEDAKIKIYDKGIDRKSIDKDLGRYDNFEKFLFIHRSGDILIPKIDFAEPLRFETRHFIDCIRTRKEPMTNGHSGLTVVKVLEGAARSLKEHGRRIKL